MWGRWWQEGTRCGPTYPVALLAWQSRQPVEAPVTLWGRTGIRLSPHHHPPHNDLGVLAPHPAASTDTTPRTRPWVRFPPADPWHHPLQHDPARQVQGVGRGPKLRAPWDGDGKGAFWHVTVDQDIWGRQNLNPQCLPVCPASLAALVVPAFPGDPDGEERKASGLGLPAACQTSAWGISLHTLSSHSPAE